MMRLFGMEAPNPFLDAFEVQYLGEHFRIIVERRCYLAYTTYISERIIYSKRMKSATREQVERRPFCIAKHCPREILTQVDLLTQMFRNMHYTVRIFESQPT